MTRKQLWYAVLASVSICMVIVLGTLSSRMRQPMTAAQTTAAETQPQIGFVLRAWQGHMGLFRGDSETPYRELDMPLSLLSAYDRRMVEEGITVDTEEELRRLVEDLTS